MAVTTAGRDGTQYYFISDLHIGGDEQLGDIAFETELIDFLRDLEESDENAELVVNGDFFGLWEFTDLDGMDKFDALVERYPALFEQLRATGERIAITFMPGNHDYELATYPEYVERLAEYNVTLQQEIVLTREVAGRTIWIEHGQQRDPNNRSPDFGNPYANPPGYFVNQHVTSRAGRLSGRGRYNWLRDIQSVTPMTEIPNWMVSKYFYREMSPLLRYAILPFLLLFNISVLFLVVVFLSVTGVWPAPLVFLDRILGDLSVIGVLVNVVLVVNVVVIVVLLILSIPAFFIARDARKTLSRFGLIDLGEPASVADRYTEGAREVFETHPEVAVFVYGHTHRASVVEIDDRVVVNTGTWLKRLHRQSVLLGLLPWVFYPSFRLNYVRITAEKGAVAVDYRVIEKPNPKDLTLLERSLTRKPQLDDPIPARVVVDHDGRSASSELGESPTQSPSDGPDG